jgi:hypothetical protein
MVMANANLANLLFQINLARGRYLSEFALAPWSAQVYSQNGEDGIIAEIFRRTHTNDKFFVEFGVGHGGLENNTRFLLETGWRGVWLEGDPAGVEAIKENFVGYVEDGRLIVRHAHLDAESINYVLDEADVPATFDFLSADIDLNTSHVWRAISRRSRVACVEYNASIPPMVNLEARYEATGSWDGTNFFGGSLKALELIGRGKGLSLVGCELAGANAFFVDADEARGRFREPFTAEEHWEPPRYHTVGHVGHPASRTARFWTQNSEQKR